MAKDWYEPREIRFTRQHCLWLIQNLATLRNGQWPGAEYIKIDIPIGKRTRKGKASFETPIDFAVEMEDRLEHVGTDGLILEAIECWDKGAESMSKYLRMSIRSILNRRKHALSYIASGPARRWHDTKKRKGETYRDFINRKREAKSVS